MLWILQCESWTLFEHEGLTTGCWYRCWRTLKMITKMLPSTQMSDGYDSGNVVKQVWELRVEVVLFWEMKKKNSFWECCDLQWCTDFAFLVDPMTFWTNSVKLLKVKEFLFSNYISPLKRLIFLQVKKRKCEVSYTELTDSYLWSKKIQLSVEWSVIYIILQCNTVLKDFFQIRCLVL